MDLFQGRIFWVDFLKKQRIVDVLDPLHFSRRQRWDFCVLKRVSTLTNISCREYVLRKQRSRCQRSSNLPTKADPHTWLPTPSDTLLSGICGTICVTHTSRPLSSKTKSCETHLKSESNFILIFLSNLWDKDFSMCELSVTVVRIFFREVCVLPKVEISCNFPQFWKKSIL